MSVEEVLLAECRCNHTPELEETTCGPINCRRAAPVSKRWPRSIGPIPKPAHRQVLVKVRACSLNFRDLGIVRGTYRMPVRDNVVPLSDGAGEVVEVGSASRA